MVDRSGKKVKWDMANNNSQWVHPPTLRNIDVIYQYLEGLFLQAQEKGRRMQPRSYTQISKEVDINPKQVAYACRLMAYKLKPLTKIHAISYGTQTGGKVSEKVSLVRRLS